MSHYADLTIAGLSVWEMRNEADFPVMVLFHPEDKITYDGDLNGEVSQLHEYRVKVERFRTRLDAMGLTLQSAIDRFNAGLAALPEKTVLTEYEKELFANLTFGTWRDCMASIIHNKLSKWSYKEKLPSLSLSPEHEDYVRLSEVAGFVWTVKCCL